MTEASEIVKFFTNKIVFLTGATGFVGQLTLERLLRVCNVELVYMLIRAKKKKCEYERFNELFDDVVFDRMKEERPDYRKHVKIIIGNCESVDLGVSDVDWKMLRDQVDVVINCAATVRFDQNLRTAFKINVGAIKDLLFQARGMKQLKSFIHVSTAYSNCTKSLIEENIYAPPMTAEQLEILLTTFPDDGFFKSIEKSILQDVPNTYTYTKCVAEDLVERMAKEGPRPLPVSIVRPSIILSTYKEPVPGWINNVYGPVGVIVATCVGLMHTLHCVPENKADMVPVDYVVSALLAVAWNTARREKPAHDENKAIDIYNYTSWHNSISWNTLMEYLFRFEDNFRPIKTMWVPFIYLNRYLFVHHICRLLMHTIPAHIVDAVARILGKPPQLVKGYNKIEKFSKVISYFTCREWQMPHSKILELFDSMNEKDRKLFQLRMNTVDWLEYIRTFVHGGRIYFLKDPMTTLPEAKKRYQYILWLSYAFKALGVIILCLLATCVLSCI